MVLNAVLHWELGKGVYPRHSFRYWCLTYTVGIARRGRAIRADAVTRPRLTLRDAVDSLSA